MQIKLNEVNGDESLEFDVSPEEKDVYIRINDSDDGAKASVTVNYAELMAAIEAVKNLIG